MIAIRNECMGRRVHERSTVRFVNYLVNEIVSRTSPPFLFNPRLPTNDFQAGCIDRQGIVGSSETTYGDGIFG